MTNLVYNPMSNKDYHALLISNQILGGGADSKLFTNLREKHGFTYGSYSTTGSGRFQTQFKTTAQVRSEKADSAIVEMLREIDNMRTGKITEEELKVAKALYNGSFALKLEDPASTATYATNILINNLPKDFYKTFLQKINAVTVADVQRVAQKYYAKDKSRIVVVGNGSKILPNLARLGYPIKQYDKYADPVVEKPKNTNISEADRNTEAVNAASIIDGYLKAIGGKDEAKNLKSMRSTISMSMQGANLEGEEIKMAPNKHRMHMTMQGMKVFEMNFDGTSGYQGQMGKNTPLDSAELREAMDDKALIPQVNYISNDYKMSYMGLEKVGGDDAYKLKITKPSGKVVTEYYATKTGLLVKEETTEMANGNEVPVSTEYSDYRKVGKLMFPFAITQMQGPQELPIVIKEIKINEGVTDADFK